MKREARMGQTASRIVCLGAGGHAAMVIEALRSSFHGEIVALLDADPARHGQTVSGVPVVGDDRELGALVAGGVDGFIVSVGMVGDAGPRQRLFALGLSLGLTPVSAIHATAIVSPGAQLGAGVAILPGAIVNTGASLGSNTIVNSGAIVEHDCQVGEHAHIATGARLSGNVIVGAAAHIGIGASIRQGIRIGAAAIVGAGAVVLEDVAAGATVGGVPARPIVVRAQDR
jgi:sugar O-acyltransferase (sialic acid O-acetyltransferase NeuD family)